MNSDSLEKQRIIVKKKEYRVKEIDKLDLTDELKEEAQKIAEILSGGKTKKNKRKLHLIFMSVKYAHMNLSVSYDDIEIAKQVGLSQKETTRAYSLFGRAQTGYQPKHQDITCIDMLESLCDKKYRFGEEIKTYFIQRAKLIYDANSELRRQKIYNLTAAFFIYFCELKMMEIDIPYVIDKTNAKETSVFAIIKLIKKIDLQLSFSTKITLSTDDDEE